MILREIVHRTTTPTAWPRGVECIFHYGDAGEYKFNDLRLLDHVCITDIDGLSGPDVAANAEKNPDRDGETPLDATYGGRTVTLTGYVKAGNLDYMRYLYSELLEAFDTLEEHPLWFRWLDWRDDFTETLALTDYSYDAGTGTLQIASDGTGLQPTSTANKQLRVLPLLHGGTSPSRFTYGDGEAIVKFRAGSALTGMAVGPEFRRGSSTLKLRVLYEKSSDTLRLYKLNTSSTQLATVAATGLSIGTDYYIRARAEGAVITFSLWNEYPPDSGGTAMASQTHTLSGSDQALFPASASGLGWGLYWTPNSTADRVKMLDAAAINPGDAIIMCRKVSKIEGPEKQEGYEWTRPFMITLRASDSRMVSRKVTTISTSPPTPAVSQEYLAIFATNYGRSPASMIVTFNEGSGVVMAPDLWLPSIDKRLGSDATLGLTVSAYEPLIDSLIFDTQRHTIVDEDGNRRYSLISSETTWPDLQPGVNALRVTSEKASEQFGTGGINLNGQIFYGSENWATSGSTTDYVVDTIVALGDDDQLPLGRTNYARRQTTSDSGNGRIALAGTTNYTDATAYVQLRLTALPSSLGVTNEFGLILRYVDANNYLKIVFNFQPSGIVVIYYTRKVAGSDVIMSNMSLAVIDPISANTWYEIKTTVRSDGRYATWLVDPVTKSVLWSDEIAYEIDFDDATILNWPLSHSTLATGGTLQTGRIGILDKNGTATASTRYYAKLGIRSAMIGGQIDIAYRHSSR